MTTLVCLADSDDLICLADSEDMVCLADSDDIGLSGWQCRHWFVWLTVMT